MVQLYPKRCAHHVEMTARYVEFPQRESLRANERQPWCENAGLQTQDVEHAAVEWCVVRGHESRPVQETVKRGPELAKFRGGLDIFTFDAVKPREAKAAPRRIQKALQPSLDHTTLYPHRAKSARAFRASVSGLEVHGDECRQTHTAQLMRSPTPNWGTE